jgi:hypothetical protein
VAGARVNEVRKPELLDTSQALERSSLEDAPKGALQFIPLELDEIVKGVPDPFEFHFECNI